MLIDVEQKCTNLKSQTNGSLPLVTDSNIDAKCMGMKADAAINQESTSNTHNATLNQTQSHQFLSTSDKDALCQTVLNTCSNQSNDNNKLNRKKRKKDKLEPLMVI